MGSVRNLIQLKQSGLTDEQVEAIVNFVESNQEPLATKAALNEIKAELKADIAEVKAEVRSVKSELNGDIAEIKIGLAVIKGEFSRLDNRLTMRMAGFAVFIVSVIAALKLFA
ncbi:TPA: hypothetical protein LVM22_001170 [Klebsiella oxytoca]|nr:hypothetical protein [Klebsiella oxytoca]